MSNPSTTPSDLYDRLRRFRVLIVASALVFGFLGLGVAWTTSKFSATSVLLVQRADMNLLQALSSDGGRMSLNGRDVYLEKFLVYLNSRRSEEHTSELQSH